MVNLINEETENFAVGPWELDVKMARRLGYTEREIRNMCDNLATISRNYNLLVENRIKVNGNEPAKTR